MSDTEPKQDRRGKQKGPSKAAPFQADRNTKTAANKEARRAKKEAKEKMGESTFDRAQSDHEASRPPSRAESPLPKKDKKKKGKGKGKMKESAREASKTQGEETEESGQETNERDSGKEVSGNEEEADERYESGNEEEADERYESGREEEADERYESKEESEDGENESVDGKAASEDVDMKEEETSDSDFEPDSEESATSSDEDMGDYTDEETKQQAPEFPKPPPDDKTKTKKPQQPGRTRNASKRTDEENFKLYTDRTHVHYDARATVGYVVSEDREYTSEHPADETKYIFKFVVGQIELGGKRGNLLLKSPPTDHVSTGWVFDLDPRCEHRRIPNISLIQVGLPSKISKLDPDNIAILGVAAARQKVILVRDESTGKELRILPKQHPITIVLVRFIVGTRKEKAWLWQTALEKHLGKRETRCRLNEFREDNGQCPQEIPTGPGKNIPRLARAVDLNSNLSTEYNVKYTDRPPRDFRGQRSRGGQNTRHFQSSQKSTYKKTSSAPEYTNEESRQQNVSPPPTPTKSQRKSSRDKSKPQTKPPEKKQPHKDKSKSKPKVPEKKQRQREGNSSSKARTSKPKAPSFESESDEVTGS